MQPAIEITAAVRADADVVGAFTRLMPQLNPERPLPSEHQLQSIIDSGCTTLLLARRTDVDSIVGTLTLVVYRVPSGVRAYIEDVVVDSNARGMGVGQALVREAITRAAQHGAEVVDLTSHESRAAANRLYMRLGFQRRDTNSYRYRLPRPAAGSGNAED